MENNLEQGAPLASGETVEVPETGTSCVVLVQLRPGHPPRRYSCQWGAVSKGGFVKVMTDHGLAIGEVLSGPLPFPGPADHLPPGIAGEASMDERERFFTQLQWEKDAGDACRRIIKALGLPMKLVRVEMLFDGSKAIFSYEAGGRVDFRELVKELVKLLRVRVEMRQIGARHATKLLGGVGVCGRELCCSTFLGDFVPVSVKMAKTQNLPLNPSKISGNCGRLLCCLAYEYENYLNPEPSREAEALPEKAQVEEKSARLPVASTAGGGPPAAASAAEPHAGEVSEAPGGAPEGAGVEERPSRKKDRRGRRHRRPKGGGGPGNAGSQA